MSKDNYILIDPPVTPLSPVKEIEAWIKELQVMEQTAEVIEAIRDAEDMKQAKRRRE